MVPVGVSLSMLIHYNKAKSSTILELVGFNQFLLYPVLNDSVSVYISVTLYILLTTLLFQLF